MIKKLKPYKCNNCDRRFLSSINSCPHCNPTQSIKVKKSPKFKLLLIFKLIKMKKLYLLAILMLQIILANAQTTIVELPKNNYINGTITYISLNTDTVIYPDNEIGKILADIWIRDTKVNIPVILFDKAKNIELMKIQQLNRNLQQVKSFITENGRSIPK